jgi:hypothetical protein
MASAPPDHDTDHKGPADKEHIGHDHDHEHEPPKEKSYDTSGANLGARGSERDSVARTANERATGALGQPDAKERAKLEAFLKELREALEKDKASNHKLTKEDLDKIIDLAREQLLDRPSDWFTIDDKTPTKDRKNPEKIQEVAAGFFRGLADLYRNYKEMKAKNTHGADRYYHCLAHCESASNGAGGQLASKIISEARENYDLAVGLLASPFTGNSLETILSDCFADTYINTEGFRGGSSGTRCMDHCARFRPRGL